MSEKKNWSSGKSDGLEGAHEEGGVKESIETGESRRQILKKIVTVGGAATGMAMLPEKWVKPVVDAIVVPAHAQTSMTTTPQPTTTAATTTPQPNTTNTTPAPETTPSPE